MAREKEKSAKTEFVQHILSSLQGLSAVATILGISIWGLVHPSGSPENHFTIVYNYVADKIGVPVTADISSRPIIPSSTAVPAITAVAATPQPDFVSLHHRTPSYGVEVKSARFAHPASQGGADAVVTMQVTSSTRPLKIFSQNLVGWAVSTQTGQQCYFNQSNLNDTLAFSSYTEHIPQIQTVSPGDVQLWNVRIYCSRPIASTEQFFLTVRLSLLPEDAVAGVRALPTDIVLTSDAIPLD